MAFPSDNLTTVHLDSGLDSPVQARLELLAVITKVKAIINAYAVANGLAPLNSSGKLSASYLNATDVTAALNVATTSLKGLMSSADKTKLDGLSGTQGAASTTVAGIVELATTAEANAGTDTVRAVTAAGLQAFHNSRVQPVSLGGTGATTAAAAVDALGVVKRDHGHNAVGSFCFAALTNNTSTHAAGTTMAGSSLTAASIAAYVNYDGVYSVGVSKSGTLSGTWRALGYAPAYVPDGGSSALTAATLWQRIA